MVEPALEGTFMARAARSSFGLLVLLSGLGLRGQELTREALHAAGLEVERLAVERSATDTVDVRFGWQLAGDELPVTLDSNGAALRADGDGLLAPGGSQWRPRELVLRPGARVEMEFARVADNSHFALMLHDVDPRGEARAVMVGWPAGEGRRADSVARIEVRGESAVVLESKRPSLHRLEPGEKGRLTVAYRAGEVHVALGEDKKWQLPWAAKTWRFSVMLPDGGGTLLVRSLVVDGLVSQSSLRKMTRATTPVAAPRRDLGGELTRAMTLRAAGLLRADLLRTGLRSLPLTSWERRERERAEREVERLREERERERKRRERSGSRLPDFGQPLIPSIPLAPDFGGPAWPESVLSSDRQAHEHIKEAYGLRAGSAAQLEAALARAEKEDSRAAIIPILRALRAERDQDFVAAEAAWLAATRCRGGRRIDEAWIGLARARVLRRDFAGALDALEEVPRRSELAAQATEWKLLAHVGDCDPDGALRMLRGVPEEQRPRDLERLLSELIAQPEWMPNAHGRGTSVEVATSSPDAAAGDVVVAVRRHLAFLEDAFPLGRQPRRRLRVWVFDTEQEYAQYVSSFGAVAENTGGVYSRLNRTLMFYDTVDARRDRHVTQHETWHAYLHRAVDEAPLWFNEGFAEFFATVEQPDRGDRVVGGLCVDRVATLRQHLAGGGELLPFRRLMRMAPGAFMTSPDVSLHYAQSWALVHWLRTVQDADVQRLHDGYVRQVLDGADAEACWSATFGRLGRQRLRTLEAAFRRYVERLLEPGRGRDRRR